MSARTLGAHLPMAARRADDDDACLQVLARGSVTFALAARLLPRPLRRDFAAIYAFCREADDAVDLAPCPHAGLAAQRARLDAICAAASPEALPTPTCRALARTMRRRVLSPVPLRALLEGFAWDVDGRTYPTLFATLAYAARAAGSVGVLLAQLMGVRAPWALARAADMGVAMQLTNIARDVGEDARRGRVYLPASWLNQAGVVPASLGQNPQHSPALGAVVHRLLHVADLLYARARLGFAALPTGPRFAVAAAARLYADIGRSVRRAHGNAVDARAYVTAPRKAVLVTRGIGDALAARWPAHAPTRGRGPLAPCAFLLGAKGAHAVDATRPRHLALGQGVP